MKLLVNLSPSYAYKRVGRQPTATVPERSHIGDLAIEVKVQNVYSKGLPRLEELRSLSLPHPLDRRTSSSRSAA